MNVLIRADASSTIGSGHVMRCLTIAHQLKQLSYSIQFWMIKLPGDLIDLVKNHGFPVIEHAVSVDILIVDHYQLDFHWEKEMRSWADHIVVIDDLANRLHDCDLLIDPNVVAHYDSRYNDLVPKHCKKLLGPAYLIMRDEFIKVRQLTHVRNGNVKRLLVFMGGSDPTNETCKVLQALKQTNTLFEHIDVVVGQSNANIHEVERLCRDMAFDFHCQIDYMAMLMSRADFCIGAGGSTAWERCYVGLPSSCTVVAENQRGPATEAHRLGVLFNLGWHAQVSIQTYTNLLDTLPNEAANVRQLSERGWKLTGDHGATRSWLPEVVGLLS